jgi:hypothetical protein
MFIAIAFDASPALEKPIAIVDVSADRAFEPIAVED